MPPTSVQLVIYPPVDVVISAEHPSTWTRSISVDVPNEDGPKPRGPASLGFQGSSLNFIQTSVLKQPMTSDLYIEIAFEMQRARPGLGGSCSILIVWPSRGQPGHLVCSMSLAFIPAGRRIAVLRLTCISSCQEPDGQKLIVLTWRPTPEFTSRSDGGARTPGRLVP